MVKDMIRLMVKQDSCESKIICGQIFKHRRAFLCSMLVVSVFLCILGYRSLFSENKTVQTDVAVPASVNPLSGQYTCPGVPDASVRLMFKDISLRDVSIPNEDGGFSSLECYGRVGSNESTRKTVFESLIGRKSLVKDHGNDYRGPGSEKFAVEGVDGASGDVRVMPENGGVSSLITCGDAIVLVRIYNDEAAMKGDIKENVKNLALSMTPWACNGEAIPGLGVSLSPSPPSPNGFTSASLDPQGIEAAPAENQRTPVQ